MNKKLILLVIAITPLVVLSGCGQKSLTEKQLENAVEDSMGQNVDVDMGNGEVKITTEDGSVMEVGGGVSIPTDFPKDVYVVDGDIASAMKNVMGAGYQSTLSNGKTVSENQAIYEEELIKEGWTIGQSFAMGDTVMLSANKDDRTTSVTISIDPDNEGTTMVIINAMEALN